MDFQNGLFKENKAILLSANGPNAKFAETDGNGNFLRRPDGHLVLRDSQIGKSVQAATQANVEKLYTKLRQENPDEAVVVYGDHGDPKGLSLWDEGTLPIQDHFRLRAQVPNKTLLRSIYIQCFAGSHIVDTNRKLPSDPSALFTFVNKHYPADKCALGLSRHNEVGQYVAHIRDPKKSLFGKYFKESNPPSLNGLKALLNSDQDVAPTTVLTSDYLAEDLAKFFCAPENRAFCEDGKQPGTESLLRLDGKMMDQFCNNDLEQEIKAIDAQIMDSFNRQGGYEQSVRYFATEFISNQDKELSDIVKINSALEYYRYMAGTTDDPEKKSEFEKKVAELSPMVKPDAAERINSRTMELVTGQEPAFEDQLKEDCNERTFRENPVMKQMIHPDYVDTFIKNLPAKFDCRTELSKIQPARTQLQKQGKKLQLAQAARRDGLVSALLQNPKLKAVKERYENLRKCEASSLR